MAQYVMLIRLDKSILTGQMVKYIFMLIQNHKDDFSQTLMTMFVEADAGRLKAKINLLLMNAE